MARFEGRVVIVTGAASGIGFEMAAQFLAEGARIPMYRPSQRRPL